MNRNSRNVLLLPTFALTLTLSLTLGCGSEPEPAPPLTESVQAEIAAEDAQVESEEMQQMNQ